MIKIIHRLKSSLALVGMLSLPLFFYACDVLENDGDNATPVVQIEDKEVFAVSSGSAYIDLFSMVKTSGKIRVNVSSQPTNGNLSEVSAGFLKYSPHGDFKKGRDAFAFDVFSENNQLITSDSVIIIVDDSTHLPCNYYPQDDSVDTYHSPVDIDVLSNDVICGDSSDLVLEVYHPGNNFPPSMGQAQVVNGKIRYTPSNKLAIINDVVVYKIYRSSNPQISGFATVRITIRGGVCALQILDDHYDLQAHALADSVTLPILNNDNFCSMPYDSFRIVAPPQVGYAWIENDSIKYFYDLPDSSSIVMDSLRYRVCFQRDCRTASVTIKVSK
jgi:hypothetical protein